MRYVEAVPDWVRNRFSCSAVYSWASGGGELGGLMVRVRGSGEV